VTPWALSIFAAGIQAALDAPPPPPGRVTVAQVEGVLGALTQTLPPLGLELNLRKTTVWGPGLVPASSPLAAAARLHFEEGTEVLGVPI